MARRVGLSKSRILSGLQCAKRLWLERHRPELAEISTETERLFAAGHQVGEVARGLYPEGRLIEAGERGLSAALAETRALLAGPGDLTLFEATFSRESVLVRVDLLFRDRSGRRLVEVKSATQVKDYHLTDAAVQAWVVTGCGFAPDSVGVACIDTSFVYPGQGDYRGLFRVEDVTARVAPRVARVPGWVVEFKRVLTGPRPAIAVGPQCFEPFACPFFGFCGPEVSEYPLTILPWAGSLTATLAEEGYADLRDVPEERLTSEVHRRVWRATRTGAVELEPVAVAIVNDLAWPRFYLDFETASPAVPRWPGTRPYEQVPFQWSCHVEAGPSGDVDHHEFLADGSLPPMRECAERLLETLGAQGPIIVYGHFEVGVIRELAGHCPDLAVRLNALAGRLVDLLGLLRRHYYHPAMKGSWSLKSVLPTVARELDYAQLGDVREGGAAQQAYLEMIDPATAPARRDELQSALLAYCERDTLALVRLTRFLAAGGA